MVEEKKKPLGEYQTAILVGGSALLLILVMVFAIGLPLFRSMNNSKKELEDKQAELTDLEERLSVLQGLEAKKEDLKVQNAKVLAALPSDDDVSRLFVQFEKIATENGLTVQSVSGASAGTTAPSGELTAPVSGSVTPATYTVSGSAKSYDAFKAALAKVENALRVISVSKINVSGTKNNLGLNLSVTTYVRGAE